MSKWPDIRIDSPWGRLVLARPNPKDDAAVAALRTHPESRRYLPFLPTSLSPDEWASKREARAAQDDVWDFHCYFADNITGTVDPLNPLLPGQCTIMHIDRDNRCAETGLLVHPSLHRSGVATEMLYMLLAHAFEHPELKLHRLDFTTSLDNVKMRGWLEKFGAVHEYTFREKWADGKGGWIDVVGYRILDREWPKIREKIKKWLDAGIGRKECH